MKKHANSIDVARRAGVSQTTVSFVLNNCKGHAISAETRQRVLEAAEQLRYRSNRLSHGLFRGRTGLIGVVVPSTSEEYLGKLLHGISNECVKTGSRPVLAYSGQDEQDAPAPLQSLIEYRVDGVVYIWEENGTPNREPWLRELLDKEVPCVIIDDYSHASEIDCFAADDVNASRSAVETLIAAGHRRIAHLGVGDKVTTAVDRLEGYRQAMSNASLDSEGLIFGHSYLMEYAAEAVRQLLSLDPLPTAVFAANDRLAGELVKQLRRIGLDCPRDMAVIGYGNTVIAHALDLTSIDQYPERIAGEAMRRLVSRMNDPTPPTSLHRMECRLIERISTTEGISRTFLEARQTLASPRSPGDMVGVDRNELGRKLSAACSDEFPRR